MKLSQAEYDALPEMLKAMFVKEGDGYVKNFSTAEEVAGLKDSNEKLIAEKKAAREKETAAEKAAREAAEALARKNGDVESLEKSWTEKHNKLAAEFEEYKKTSGATIHGLTVGAKVAELGANIFQKNAHLGEHILRSRLGLNDKNEIVVLGADGKPSALTVEELEKEIRSDERYAPIVAAPISKGTPAGKRNESQQIEPPKAGKLDNLDIARQAIQDMPQVD